MAREGCRIAVIGAGFSGVMTAIHLLWRCEPGRAGLPGRARRPGRPGPGLRHPQSAPPRQRARGEHERVRRRAGPFRPLARAARARAARRGRRAHDRRHLRAPLGVRRLRPGAAARGDRAPGRGRQSLPGHRRGDRRSAAPTAASSSRPATAAAYPIDAAVLALGNVVEQKDEPPGLRRQSLVARPRPHRCEPGRPVVVLGTGLTMVDVCLALTEQGFEGPIHAISRRGLLPLGHAPSKPWEQLRAHGRRPPLAAGAVPRRPPRGPARRGERGRLARGDRRGAAARADPVGRARARPTRRASSATSGPGGTSTATAWRRRSRPRWPPCAPPAPSPPMPAGSPRSSRPATPCGSAGGPRAQAVEQQLLAQRVIDCTGSTGDHCRSGEPLIQQMLADGLVRPAPFGPRRRLHHLGRPDRRRRQARADLFAVGPVTRGALWEIIAVPEIRAQAEQVAERVLAAARSRAAA